MVTTVVLENMIITKIFYAEENSDPGYIKKTTQRDLWDGQKYTEEHKYGKPPEPQLAFLKSL